MYSYRILKYDVRYYRSVCCIAKCTSRYVASYLLVLVLGSSSSSSSLVATTSRQQGQAVVDSTALTVWTTTTTVLPSLLVYLASISSIVECPSFILDILVYLYTFSMPVLRPYPLAIRILVLVLVLAAMAGLLPPAHSGCPFTFNSTFCTDLVVN